MRSRLVIATPDGSGQAIHPDVVDTGTGFAGHRFWMACTPYPSFDNRLENPTIRVSDDGISWTPVPGAPDPAIPPPTAANEHWSDTDLVVADGRLHLYFRHCAAGGINPSILVSTSEDGVIWSEPRTIVRGRSLLSPAIVTEANDWWMWYVAGSKLLRRTGTAFDTFGEPTLCQAAIPGYVLWHIDVIKTAEGFEALVCAYREGLDATCSRVFHMVSDDGLRFELSRPDAVIKPRLGTWTSRMVYRSTFQKYEGGRYRIWYSGASWSKVTGIGLAEGPVDALDYSQGSEVEQSSGGLARELMLQGVWRAARSPAGRWARARTPDRALRLAAKLIGQARERPDGPS